MTESTSPPTTIILASFFKRLDTIEPIMRVIMSGAPLKALLTFRGEPEKKVLMDFSGFQASISIDEKIRTGDIIVTIKGDVMHDVLLRRIDPGVALGRREMLLRGSAHNLAKFIPLFEFSPILYSEHLADIGINGFTRRSGEALLKPEEAPVKPGEAPEKEKIMNDKVFKGDPIPLIHLSVFERAIFKMLKGISYVLGYFVGFMRYRLFEKLSLFEMLGAMSRGLDAAAPKRET